MAKQSVSGRVKKKTGSQLDSFRYDYLSLENAEPDFGLPSSNAALITSDIDGTRAFRDIVGSNNQIEITTSTNDIQISFTDSITVANTINAQDINSKSDVSLKENVTPIEHGVKTIQAINPVSFTWKNGSGVAYGVIAQEIENIIPAIVSENDEGIKSVSYTQIIAFLIKAVQEQQEQIDELKSQLP